MDDMPVTTFTERHLTNSQDAENFLLFLSGLGVKTVADLRQIPETSWITLGALLSPGSVATLRAELSSVKSAPPTLLPIVSGTPPVPKVPISNYVSPVRRNPIPLSSPPPPPFIEAPGQRSAERDAEPLRAAHNTSPQSAPTSPIPSPPSVSPVAKTLISTDRDPFATASSTASSENPVPTLRRQNRAAGVFKESPLRASLPGGDTSSVSIGAPLPQPVFQTAIPKAPVRTPQRDQPNLSSPVRTGSPVAAKGERSEKIAVMPAPVAPTPTSPPSAAVAAAAVPVATPPTTMPAVGADPNILNWDSFLVQTKSSKPPEEQAADDARDRADANRWNAEPRRAPAQTVAKPGGSFISRSMRTPTVADAANKRDDKRAPLWSSQKLPVEETQIPEEKTRDWPSAAQVETTFYLDLGHVLSGRSGAMASFMTTATEALQSTEALLNISLAGNHLNTEAFLPLLQLMKPRLASLEILDLSSNDLTDPVLGPLNDALGRNIVLQDLSLAGNRFTAEGLFQLLSKRPSLRFLDISHARLDNCGWRFTNMLTAFSALARLEIAYCGLSDAEFALLVGSLPTSVCILNARGNRVVVVPDAISRLVCLRHLDLSRNCLEMLSIQLAKMPEVDLDLTCNPSLVTPPKETVLAGGQAIRAWLNSYFYGDIYMKIRMYVVGHGGSGKTTLLRNFCRACQMESSRSSVADSSRDSDTVSFSSSDPNSYPKSVDLDPKIKVSIADFPGMIETTRTYSPFITSRNAICLVALDASHGRGVATLKKLADFWLTALALRLVDQNTSSMRIVLVVTKSDSLSNKAVLGTACTELFAHVKNKFPSLPVVDRVYTLSNTHSDSEMSKLVKSLRKHASDILAPEAACRVPEMFRQVEQAVITIAQASATVMDLPSFKKKVTALVVDPRIGRYGDFMWQRCLTFLQDYGVALYNAQTKTVCVQPEAILRLIAAIGIPPAVQQRGYFQQLSARPLPTIPRAVVLSRLRSLHPLSHCSEADLIRLLSFMEGIELCFALNDRERAHLNIDGYWFPALQQQAELCMLPGVASGRHRFMGIQYAETNDFVLHEVFHSLQVALRPYFDLTYKVFSNAMLLRSDNARALVHLTEGAINFIVAADTPQVMLSMLWEKLNFTSRVRREMPQTLKLCPRCIQGAGIYSTLQKETQCVAGHSLTQTEVDEGAQWERKSWCRNSIWTPKNHEEFFSSGEWTPSERYRSTVLTENDRQPARNKEYCRIRDMFYHFIREDLIRSFELDRILFIDNLDLECNFQQFFEQCAQRFLAYAEPVSGSREQLANEDPLRKEWRRWVMSHFEEYQERVSGNDSVNMVPAWHGTSEEIMFKIAALNFLEPDELPVEKQTDPGYFGKGIYFTQYPSYGAQYVKDKECLLFSWVIMGRPYPVIESPTDDRNLLGRGLVQGFDSHYVMVRQVSPQVYHPCKTSEAPDYDEMVVFTKNQILPRYIIYYRRREDPAAAGLAPASGAASRYVVWVDDNLHGETKVTIKVLSSLNPGVSYVQVTSTHELIVWIAAHEDLLTKEREALRIITCRYRERDGGEDAAKKLVESLRSDPKLKALKVLIYCNNPRDVAHLEDKKLCFIASEAKVLQEFAAFRSFGDGARLFQPLKNLLGARKDSSKEIEPKDSRKQARAVVWVDDKLPSNNAMTQSCANQGIQLVLLASTTQLKDWASDQGSLFFPRNVRIITNRYRHADGGDNAAAQLLQWLRSSDRFAACETLIFCKEIQKVAHLKSPNTAVTDNGVVTSKFCLFEPFDKLFPELVPQEGVAGL